MPTDTPPVIWEEIDFPWYECTAVPGKEARKYNIELTIMRFGNYDLLLFRRWDFFNRHKIEDVLRELIPKYSLHLNQLVVLALRSKEPNVWMIYEFESNFKSITNVSCERIPNILAIALLQGRINPTNYLARKGGTASAAPTQIKKSS